MQDTLISVVIPIYNTAIYLEKCLESVKNQTYSNIEVLLIDDGSSDGSGNIADRYALQDSRFKVKHLINGGVSRARNTGIELASGKFITFIDSDDYVAENHIYNLFKGMTGKEGLSICNYWIDENDKIKKGIQEKRSGSIKKEILIEELMRVYGGFSSNKLFDLQFIKEKNIFYDVNIRYCEDLLYVLRYILLASGEILYSEVATYYYFQREESAVHTMEENTVCSSLVARKKCVKMIEEEFPKLISIWKKQTVLQAFYQKSLFLKRKIEHSRYDIIYNEIIDEMYSEVYREANGKEKIKLYLYKNYMRIVALLKK